MRAAAGVRDLNGFVEGLSDFELGQRARTRSVTYRGCIPSGCDASSPARGLAVYIPGFGEDHAPAYADKLMRGIAETYGYACLTVDCHALRARLDQGARMVLTETGEQTFRLLCQAYGLKIGAGDVTSVLERLGGRVSSGTRLRITLVPPDGEYQNFGVLQALDHLAVLRDVVAEGLAFDANNIVLVGSSHGGYIAHLICKIAPNTINAVVDNSSYTRAPLNYLGLLPEFSYRLGNLCLDANVVSGWQFQDRRKPDFFGLGPQLLRETAFPPHLAVMQAAAERLPRYFGFNSVDDDVSPIREKRAQAKALAAIGCDVSLREVTRVDLDGRMFKTLDHGMNASMRALCDAVLPDLAARPTTLDVHRKTSLRYDAYEAVYQFEHGGDAPGLRATMSTS